MRYSTLIIVVLFFLSFGTTVASAQTPDYNPTSCEFQYPLADRRPTITGITHLENQPTSGLWTNYSWDETLPGLHRNNLAGWPGVDFLYPVTLPFKNGGVVDKVGWDEGSTGGHSIWVKGIDQCAGWYVYMGHLDYDPTTRYQVGDFIGPNEVVGVPGCSGAEERCKADAKPDEPIYEKNMYWKHVHFSLGYSEDVFDFGDGTEVAYQAGYYWIHVARMEDMDTNMRLLAPPPDYVSGNQELMWDNFTGWYLVDKNPVLEFLNFADNGNEIKFDSRMILIAGVIYCLFGLVLYNNLKQNLVLFFLTMIVILLIIGLFFLVVI